MTSAERHEMTITLLAHSEASRRSALAAHRRGILLQDIAQRAHRSLKVAQARCGLAVARAYAKNLTP